MNHLRSSLLIFAAALMLSSCGKTCTEFSGTYIPHDVSALPLAGTYQFESCPSCPSLTKLYQVAVSADSTIVQTIISNDGDTTVTVMKPFKRKTNTLYEKTY